MAGRLGIIGSNQPETSTSSTSTGGRLGVIQPKVSKPSYEMPSAPYPVQKTPSIPVVDNRPYPMRVPGTVPTAAEQIKYAPKPIAAEEEVKRRQANKPDFSKMDSITRHYAEQYYNASADQIKKDQQVEAKNKESSSNNPMNEAYGGKIMSKEVAKEARTKLLSESNKFYDTEYETAQGKIKGKDMPVQSKIFEPVDTSKNSFGEITIQSALAKGSKTYGQIVDKYNSLSAADQHRFLSDLQKVASSNPLNSPELQKDINDASIALSLLEEKGQNKSGDVASFLSDLGSGALDAAMKGSKAVGALFESGVNAASFHPENTGTTYVEQKAEQDFKDGKIDATQLAKIKNESQLSRYELIGEKPKEGFEGVIDKALRLGGAVANTAGLVMPLESFWSASAKSLSGMTAKEIAITYFKEGINNAVVNTLGAFQSTGTDTKWEDVLTQAAMGAGFGVGGRALGDVVGYLTKAKMTPKMFAELPPEIQLDYIKKATANLPVDDIKEVADAVKTGAKKIEEIPTKDASTRTNLEESLGTKIPDRHATNLAENAPEAPVVDTTPQVSKTEVPTAETPVIEAPKVETPKTPEQTQFNSRVFERMKAEHPEVDFGDNLNVEAVRLQADADRAIAMIETDKQKAFNIAMGVDKSDEVLSTSVNIAMTEKALADGNNELAARLIKNRSLEQTRRGQEISAERSSVTNNSTSRYVKEVIADRLAKLGKKYLGDLNEKALGGKSKSKSNGMDVIDKQVTSLETKIKTKKLDVKTAVSLLEKMACL